MAQWGIIPAAGAGNRIQPLAFSKELLPVVTRHDGAVVEVQVKLPRPSTPWVWGAIGMPGELFHELRELWLSQPSPDEYLGTLFNRYLEQGGSAVGVPIGQSYVDVGTLNG